MSGLALCIERDLFESLTVRKVDPVPALLKLEWLFSLSRDKVHLPDGETFRQTFTLTVRANH